MWMLRPAVEDILSTACPDPQSASTFIVAVSELVYKVNLLVCPITSSLLLCLYVCVCVLQISMISVMRWTAQVPCVLSLTVAVHLELSWDQTDKHAWVRQAEREEERGQIS